MDFIEKHIPYKGIKIIPLNDYKMFIKALRLALNDSVNISQIIKHKQNLLRKYPKTSARLPQP